MLPSTTLHFSALQSTTRVLIWTTKYYSSTTLYYKDSDTSPYYKVLRQYLSGHPYYKVLLQYYSVPQSTTPVLLCTTRYYCYSVLNSTTYYSCTSHAPTSPNAAPATQNDCHDWSCSHMKRYLMLFTMREAAQDTLPLHQMLHLPRKTTVMIDRAHIWNAIDNARSSARHPPTSPNAAPAKEPDFKRKNLLASQCSQLTSRQPSTPTSPLSCRSPSKRHYPNARAEKISSPAVPDTKRRNWKK